MQIFSVFLSKLVNLARIQFAVWNLQFAWGKRKYFNVPMYYSASTQKGARLKARESGGGIEVSSKLDLPRYKV